MSDTSKTHGKDLVLPVLGLLCLAMGIWSVLGTHDVGVWCFELLPLTAVLVIFAVRSRWFRFSNFGYGSSPGSSSSSASAGATPSPRCRSRRR